MNSEINKDEFEKAMGSNEKEKFVFIHDEHHKEVFRVGQNGEIFLRGKKIGNSSELYKHFNSFVVATGKSTTEMKRAIVYCNEQISCKNCRQCLIREIGRKL